MYLLLMTIFDVTTYLLYLWYVERYFYCLYSHATTANAVRFLTCPIKLNTFTEICRKKQFQPLKYSFLIFKVNIPSTNKSMKTLISSIESF